MVGPSNRLASAIERGLRFLDSLHLTTGEFPAYIRHQPDTEYRLDHSPFPTAVVAIALEQAPHEVARAIRRRSAAFLSSQMPAHGVWKYYLREDPRYEFAPYDVDDTVCISRALRGLGADVPDIRSALLANRDSRGRFFTWFAPRLRPFPISMSYWTVVGPALMHPVSSGQFWRGEASRDDVDCVVNANALEYLGDAEGTAGVTRYLIEVLAARGCNRCDRWYQSAVTFAHAVSRCLRAGVRSLQAAQQTLIERTVAFANPDGSIGNGALETGLGASTLLNCDYTGPELLHALDWLLSNQDESGRWPISDFFYSGPARTASYRSDAVTSSFCLEPLVRAD